MRYEPDDEYGPGNFAPISMRTSTRMEKIDMWLRRHWFIDFFFVGIGGCVLIVAALVGLSVLGGQRMMDVMGMPIACIAACWLLIRMSRLRSHLR